MIALLCRCYPALLALLLHTQGAVRAARLNAAHAGAAQSHCSMALFGCARGPASGMHAVAVHGSIALQLNRHAHAAKTELRVSR